MAQGYDLRITVTGEDKASAPIGGIKGALSGLSGAFSGLASAATLGAAGAVAGLAAVGAAGLAAWGDYDAALDTVMQKTGVTGDALDTMGESIKRISGSTAGVGTDMAHIGEVMADLQVRTGATGGTLDELTGRLLQLQQVQGDTAVSAQNFGRLLGDWAVPAEQGAGLMDQLFTASQKFGVSTDSLASKLVQFGSPLRQMGFDLQTSIAMFGQFEQQGVNTELVLGSLRIAAGKFADAHIPLQQGLSDTIKRIHDMSDSSAALGVAMDVFGARAGPDMAAAIREGKFSLDDAVASLQNYQGSIQSAAEGAMDFPDQWAMGMNQVKAALVPVGQAVMDLGSAAMPILQTGFSLAAGAITSFASGLSGLASTVGPVISAIGGFFSDSSMEAETLETTLSGLVGSGAANALTDMALAAFDFGTALSALSSGDLTTLTSSLASGIGNVARAFGVSDESAQQFTLGVQNALIGVASAAQSIGSGIGSLLSSAFQTAGQMAQSVLSGIPALLQAVQGPISTIASLVGSVLSSAFQSAGSIIQSVLGILPGLVQIGMSVLTSLAGTVSSVVAGAFQILAPIAQSVMAGIATVVQMAMPGVMSLAQAVGNLLVTAFNVLRDIALAVFGAIQPYIPAVQQAIGRLAEIVGSVLATAFQKAADFIQGTVIPGLQRLGAWLAENIPVAIQKAADFWTNVLQPAIATAWGYIQNNLIPLFNELIGWLQTNIPKALQALSDFWQQHGDQILTTAQTAWQTIQDVIGAVLDTISGLWTAWNQAREGDWTGFGETLRSIWDASWEAIKNVISTVGPQIVAALVQLASDAYNAFTSVDWGQLGSDVVRGIANGITAGVGAIIDAARNAARAALEAARGFLDSHSPSRRAADEVGVPLAQGIAVGFLEGMAGQGIPQIIGGLRALMEQLAGVLANVGDALSTSDWEDLANPVARMADVFKSITEVGHSILATDLASTWSAAQGQVASFVQSARALLEQVSPLLDNPGALSVSDWEDFVAPLKLMAEAMTQITGIAGLFEGGNVPSLAGLSAGLARLASEARQLLVDLDLVIGPIGPFLAEKLKNLGEAAAGAKAVAENALGLVRVLQEALTVDWGSINFSAAGKMMHDLAMQVAWFAQKAEEAGLAIQKTDTSGLAVLKSAAESLIGIADGARSLVTKLVDALGVKWGSINFSAAGRMMADLARMVLFFTERALAYAAALRGLDTDALSVIKSAAENLLGIATSAQEVVTRLAASLTYNWAGVQWSQAGRLMAEMTRVVVLLTQEALTYAGALRNLDTTGLAAIQGAAQGVRDAAEAAFGLVQFALESLKLDWSRINFQALRDSITRLLLAGQQIAGAARDVMAGWTGEAIPALTTLGGILTDALSVVNDTFGAVDRLLGGQGLPAGAMAVPPGGGSTPLQNAIWRLVLAAQQISQTVQAAMGNWNTLVPPGLANLKEMLSGSLGIFEDTFKLIDAVMGGGSLAGVSAAFTPSATGPDTRSPIWQRISALIVYATSLADMIRLAIGSWDMAVPPGLATLKGVLADSLGIFGDTFKLVDAVMGDEGGGISAADFTPSATGPDTRSPIWRRISQLVTYATSLADMIRLSIGTWTTEVPPGLAALKALLSDSLGAIQDTFSLVDALTGDKFPDLAGEAAGPNGVILQRLQAVLAFGMRLSEESNRVIGQWTAIVAPGLAALARTLKGSLDAVSSALDLSALLSGDKFPDVASLQTVVLTRLAAVLTVGMALADEVNRVIGTWTTTVKPALASLASILKSDLDTAGSVLDLSDLLSGDKFPDLASLQSTLTARLATVLTVGMALADEANRVIGQWATTVKPSLANLARILKSDLEAAGAVLDLNALLGGKTFPTPDLSLLTNRLETVLRAGMALGDKANEAIGAWNIVVKPALDNLGKTLKSSLDVVGSVLDFSELQSRLASFRGLDMRVVGPKLDMIIASAIAVAQQFGQRAANAGIKEEWQKAGAALKALFGDAVDSLLKAVDLGEKLADPSTQIPSVGQVQAKLTAVLDFLGAVVSQFSASASSLASSGVDFTAVTQIATSAKSAFDVIMSAVDTISTLREKHIGMDDLDNIRQFLRQVFTIFNEFDGQTAGVEAVTSAVTTLLGGLQTLAASSGFSAGQSWASQFTAGINAGLGNVTEGATRALARLTGGGGTGNGNVTITTNTYHNTYNNSLSLNVDTANAEAVTLNFNLLEAMSGA